MKNKIISILILVTIIIIFEDTLSRILAILILVTIIIIFEDTLSRILALEKTSRVQIICEGYKVNPVTLNYTGRNCAILTSNEFVKNNKDKY